MEITAKEILSGGIFSVLSVMTLLQIVPIRVNPWSWLARAVGRAFNRELLDKLDAVKKEVDDIGKRVEKQGKSFEEEKAIACRIRILRFADEMTRSIKHSKDHFDQTMVDIDTYESYCRANDGFRNSITAATIARVRASYAKRLENNDFI